MPYFLYVLYSWFPVVTANILSFMGANKDTPCITCCIGVSNSPYISDTLVFASIVEDVPVQNTISIGRIPYVLYPIMDSLIVTMSIPNMEVSKGMQFQDFEFFG